jgi:DNA polymerase-1
MKNKYKSIFDLVKKEHSNAPPELQTREKNSEVLLVDGTNQFIRTWLAVPTLTDNGEHCGGISGFLTTLGYAIRLLKPTRVIVVFDGKGGSLRRRKIYPEYKNKRKVLMRVNRAYEELSDPDEEVKSMMRQIGTLVNDFLTTLPVSVVAIDNIEADDTIGYITTQIFNTPNNRVTIMSGDRDFLQLVNERVCVWSPIKKKIYGVTDIINQYGVHPSNFVYYRALAGDTSDNIDGIRGLGLKTIIKRFPMLTEQSEATVDKLIEHANNRVNESKAYQSVVQNQEILTRNYRLMQLKTPDFPAGLQLNINNAIDKKVGLNKFLFIQNLTKHGMHSSIRNYHLWLQETFFNLVVD